MTDRQQSEQPVPYHVHGNEDREIEKDPENHPANIFHVGCSPRNSIPDQPSLQIHHADHRGDENAKAQTAACRSSSQISHFSGGSSVSANWVPHVTQMKQGIVT